MNCFSPEWTVGGFCFPGVVVDFGLKRENFSWSLNLRFGDPRSRVAAVELTVEDDPRES